MLKNNVAIMAIKWPNNCIPEMGSSQGNNWVPSAMPLYGQINATKFVCCQKEYKRVTSCFGAMKAIRQIFSNSLKKIIQ